MRKFIYLFLMWWFRIIQELVGKIYLIISKPLFKTCGNKVYFVGIPFISGISKVSIGHNTSFGGNLYIRGEGGLTIGNNCVIANDLIIYTYSHNYQSDYLPIGNNDVYKEVIIEDNVWIGKDVTILPGVKVGEGAILGISSVVVKDVEKFAIVGGNPAKVLKYRDQKHYHQLLKKNKINTVKTLWFYVKKIYGKT